MAKLRKYLTNRPDKGGEMRRSLNVATTDAEGICVLGLVAFNVSGDLTSLLSTLSTDWPLGKHIPFVQALILARLKAKLSENRASNLCPLHTYIYHCESLSYILHSILTWIDCSIGHFDAHHKFTVKAPDNFPVGPRCQSRRPSSSQTVQ